MTTDYFSVCVHLHWCIVLDPPLISVPVTPQLHLVLKNKKQTYLIFSDSVIIYTCISYIWSIQIGGTEFCLVEILAKIRFCND